jgi:hypothetical protein
MDPLNIFELRKELLRDVLPHEMAMKTIMVNCICKAIAQMNDDLVPNRQIANELIGTAFELVLQREGAEEYRRFSYFVESYAQIVREDCAPKKTDYRSGS